MQWCSTLFGHRYPGSDGDYDYDYDEDNNSLKGSGDFDNYEDYDYDDGDARLIERNMAIPSQLDEL